MDTSNSLCSSRHSARPGSLVAVGRFRTEHTHLGQDGADAAEALRRLDVLVRRLDNVGHEARRGKVAQGGALLVVALEQKLRPRGRHILAVRGALRRRRRELSSGGVGRASGA